MGGSDSITSDQLVCVEIVHHLPHSWRCARACARLTGPGVIFDCCLRETNSQVCVYV